MSRAVGTKASGADAPKPPKLAAPKLAALKVKVPHLSAAHRPSREELDAAFNWLMSDDTGSSSETILFYALGKERRSPHAGWGFVYPSDAGDLGRCLRLMKALPWVRERAFPRMAKLAVWRRLIPAWDELEALMLGEVGINGENGKDAKKTYARLKKLLGED